MYHLSKPGVRLGGMVGGGGGGVPGLRNAGPSISHTLNRGLDGKGLKADRNNAGVLFITFLS